jgi:hypothetical protein
VSFPDPTEVKRPDLLTLQEVADQLGVSHVTVWRWATGQAGWKILPTVTIRNKRYVLRDHLTTFLQAWPLEEQPSHAG